MFFRKKENRQEITKPLKVSTNTIKFYLLAVVSGLFYGLLFPPVQSSYLIFGAIVPFIAVIVEGRSSRKAWLAGFFFGISAAFMAIPWIFFNTGASPVVRLFSGLSLIMVVGLFHAFFAWFSQMGIALWGKRAIWLFPLFWLGMEQVMYYEEITFPWIMLCNTLTYKLSFIQVADLFGSSFVSLLVIYFNVAIYSFLNEVFRPRKNWPMIILPPVSAVVIFFLVQNYGDKKLVEYQQKTADAPTYPVALIHPSMEAEAKWRSKNLQEILDVQTRLSDSLADSVKLIVWGEANFPGYLQTYPEIKEGFKQYALAHKLNFIVGALGFDRVNDSTYLRYNSAFHFADNGAEKRYDKIKLVPFGEAFAFAEWLPWMKNISLGQANFDRGKEFTVFNGGAAKYSVSICYEGIFSYYNAEFVRKGADFLINISNDAWYEKSTQNDQHSRFNIFRAIENRRSIVRLANRAENSYIDPTGNLHRLFEPEDVIGKKVEVALIKDISFFTRYHNVIKYIFIIISGSMWLVMPLISWLRKRRKDADGEA